MKNQEKLVILFVAATALFLGQFFYQLQAKKTYSDTTHVYQPKRELNAFVLTDQYSNEFNNKSLENHWSFVFLGYLSCPDICPMTMAKLSNLLPKLSDVSEIPVQVLFVSVDPKRDEPEKRKEYVNYFHSDIKGLGAEHKNLFPFVRNLGLMYSIPSAEEENYYVDHSASVVLIDPEGKIAAIFKPKIEVGEVPTIDSSVMLKDFETLIE